VPYLAAAETLKRAGWHQTAVTLLEQGFAAGIFAPAGGLDQLALAYYADACVAAGNPRRARDTLLARLEADAAAPMTPSRTSSVRAEWMVQIMDRLIALEFFADAMAVGHRVRALPGLADSDASRRRVDQALETLRREPLDARNGSAAWKDLAAQARDAMRAHPDEPVYWENLHGLLLAGGDSDAAAALREEVRTRAGARGAWRLGLGQAAQAAVSPAEAAEDFLAALQLTPVPVFQDRRLARDILGVIAEAGRTEAFLAVIDALDWHALLQGSATGVGGPAQRLNVIMQLAEDALRRPIENPELAFGLSRHVRRRLRGLPVHVAYSDRLAGVMMRALPGLNPSVDERFAELLALMAAPPVVQALAPEAATSQGTPCWSLGMSWGADGVAGGLLDLLDAAEAAGQLPDLQRACRQAMTDGDPEQAFWACLTAARARDLADMQALLPDALAAANRFRGSPDERAFLLCALGRECSRANAHDAALRCYRDALAMGRQSNTEAVANSTTFYLASTLIDRGDREAARQILLEPWSARAAALPPVRQAGLHMQRAQTLLHLHFYVDAWVQAYEVLDQLADQPQSRQYRETTRFLDLFMESRLDDLRNAGDLLRLITTIENRWGHGPGSPELWRYLQQLYREIGDSEGEQRSLQRQARSNTSPPADS
jgi:tetratricopeptide (TPR) repeat protein